MLFNYICSLESYSEVIVLHYMTQLSDALKWLHSRNVVHLDIKPENILVSPSSKMDLTNYHGSAAVSMLQNAQLKLIDFGDAFTAINRNTILPHSNLEFSAPEVLIGHTELGTATGNCLFRTKNETSTDCTNEIVIFPQIAGALAFYCTYF